MSKIVAHKPSSKVATASSLPLFSEDMFRGICERMPGMVAVYNIRTGRYIYVNEAVKKLLGYQPADFLRGGISFVSSLVHPDDIADITRKNGVALAKANRQGTKDRASEPIVSFEYRMRHKQGHYVWFHADGSVFDRRDGEVEHVLNISVDITEQKSAMAKLAKTHTKVETAERFALSQSVAKVGTFEWQLIENQIIWSPEMEMLYGLKPGIFKGTPDEVQKYIHPEDQPGVSKRVRAAFRGGPQFNMEYRIIWPDGSVHWMIGRGKVIRDQAGAPIRFLGVNVDITDQKQTEERLALALEASQLGIWEWDIPANELVWSDQLKRIFGLKPSATVTYEQYLNILHPDDRSKLQQIIEAALKSGESYQIEHRVVWSDGSIHWVLGQGKAFLIDGKPVRMTGTSLNIDERKKTAELETITKHLIAEHKLLMRLNAAKDEFISIASHQLRTPATAVKQYLGMLLAGYAGKLSLTDDQLSMINIANESNERQIRIVSDLLRVAQVDAGKVSLAKERIDLIKLIREVINDLLKNFEAKRQTVKLTQASKDLYVFLDKAHIRMVLENILDNASKYSSDKTVIHINLGQNPRHIVIKVIDHGVGIAKSDQKKLFKKFSRVDNQLSMVAGGSGLGLYWAKKIISLHNGKISVSSKPGIGTTFTIKFPNELRAS